MSNSKTLLAATLGAALLMPAASRAQQAGAPAGKPNMELTALDYFQIQQLVSRYAQAIDTCSNSGYDYADLFTADGFFAPFATGKSDARRRVAKRWPWLREAARKAVRARAGKGRACTTSTSTTSSTPRRREPGGRSTC